MLCSMIDANWHLYVAPPTFNVVRLAAAIQVPAPAETPNTDPIAQHPPEVEH